MFHLGIRTLIGEVAALRAEPDYQDLQGRLARS